MVKKLSSIMLGAVVGMITFLCITVFPQHVAEASVDIIISGSHIHANERGIAGCVRLIWWDNLRTANFTTDRRGNYRDVTLRSVRGGHRYVIGAGSDVCGAANGSIHRLPNAGQFRVTINY